MDDRLRGLYEKYEVKRTDGREVGQCIVLEVDDPTTHAAIEAFAVTVTGMGYHKLAEDLYNLLQEQKEK